MSELDINSKRIEYEMELPNTRLGHSVSKEMARIFRKVFLASHVQIESTIDAIIVRGRIYEHQLPKVRKVIVACLGGKCEINVDTARQIFGPGQYAN